MNTAASKTFWQKRTVREEAARKIQKAWLRHYADMWAHPRCDYAGYGGACTGCGSLRCGCIDVCRCHVYSWGRWD